MITTKTTNNLLKVSFLTMIVLAVLNLVGSNILATQGGELQALNQEYLSLQKDNSHLKNQIAQAQSLNNLESWADNNGYVKISSPIALTAPAPVAFMRE